MSAPDKDQGCVPSERMSAHALNALPAHEAREVEAHVAGCEHCQAQLADLRAVVKTFAAWPGDLLRPPRSLQARLSSRIAQDTGGDAQAPPPPQWSEPEWDEPAPGIFCKLLANDAERHRVSMLVRLLPNVEYPPHTHAGVEELHLLEGELWIDDRLLCPGDYNRGEAPTGDKRVWSETGCTCVLITSTRDILA